jgi:hypothetical protein
VWSKAQKKLETHKLPIGKNMACQTLPNLSQIGSVTRGVRRRMDIAKLAKFVVKSGKLRHSFVRGTQLRVKKCIASYSDLVCHLNSSAVDHYSAEEITSIIQKTTPLIKAADGVIRHSSSTLPGCSALIAEFQEVVYQLSSIIEGMHLSLSDEFTRAVNRSVEELQEVK